MGEKQNQPFQLSFNTSWESRFSVYRVGVRRGVAKVGEYPAIFGGAGSGSRGGGGESVCKSFHLDTNRDLGFTPPHCLWGKKEIPGQMSD
jgi:hypothetical protein